MSDDLRWLDGADRSEQLVLSDLINRVLDKGVMINAHLTISVADIDLIALDLKLLISSVAALEESRKRLNADVPLRNRSGA